jgi:hypothetical protein
VLSQYAREDSTRHDHKVHKASTAIGPRRCFYGVRIVQIARFSGRIGRAGRSGCCHGCCHGLGRKHRRVVSAIPISGAGTASGSSLDRKPSISLLGEMPDRGRRRCRDLRSCRTCEASGACHTVPRIFTQRVSISQSADTRPCRSCSCPGTRPSATSPAAASRWSRTWRGSDARCVDHQLVMNDQVSDVRGSSPAARV